MSVVLGVPLGIDSHSGMCRFFRLAATTAQSSHGSQTQPTFRPNGHRANVARSAKQTLKRKWKPCKYVGDPEHKKKHAEVGRNRHGAGRVRNLPWGKRQMRALDKVHSLCSADIQNPTTHSEYLGEPMGQNFSKIENRKRGHADSNVRRGSNTILVPNGGNHGMGGPGVFPERTFILWSGTSNEKRDRSSNFGWKTRSHGGQNVARDRKRRGQNPGESHSGLWKRYLWRMVQRVGRGRGGTVSRGFQQRNNRRLDRVFFGSSCDHGCWRRLDQNLWRYRKVPTLDGEIDGKMGASNPGRYPQGHTRRFGAAGDRKTKHGRWLGQLRPRTNRSRREKTGRNGRRSDFLRIRGGRRQSTQKHGPLANPNETTRAIRQRREWQK